LLLQIIITPFYNKQDIEFTHSHKRKSAKERRKQKQETQ